MAKTWEYIDTVKKARAARKVIKLYLLQGNKADPARLAVDLETKLGYEWTGKTKRPVPRAIHDGKKWLGDVATVQIGLDPTNPEYDIRDRQFIFDVKKLGRNLVRACLGDILEKAVVMGHNIKYDLQFLKNRLGINCLHSMCTMLMSQVYFAGDRIKHNLADCSREFFKDDPGHFYNIARIKHLAKVEGEVDLWRRHERRVRRDWYGSKQAQNRGFGEACDWVFDIYKRWKVKEQQSDWSGALTNSQLRYGAWDVKLPFYLVEKQCDLLDSYVERYEKNFKKGRGINEIIQLEFGIIPLFADMETRGLKFDRKYHKEFVIPLLEKKMDEASEQIGKKWPAFRPKHERGEKSLIFTIEDPDPDQFKNDTKVAKMYTKFMQSQWQLEGNISILSKVVGGLKNIRLIWYGKATRREVFDVMRTVFSKDKGYSYKKESTINLNARDAVTEALSETLGRKITSYKASELKKIRKEDPEHAELVDWLLRYKKAKDFNSKYGRAWLKFVEPNGYIFPFWNQLGSDANEIVSGRSSCKKPALMQMAARDLLFAYLGYKGITADELIRRVIVAEKGCVFLDADYTQIEPCMVAQHSRDKVMLRIFREGLDMHGLTAQAIFQRKGKYMKAPPKKGNFDRDVVGKTTNLGVGYGMSPPAFAEYMHNKTDGAVDFSDDEAKEVLDAYWSLYGGVKMEMERCAAWALRRLKASKSLHKYKAKYNKGMRQPFGMITTDLGRPRRFCILEMHERMPDEELHRDYNPTEYRWYYNEFKKRCNKVRLAAYNHTIQGSCADMLKLAELYVWRAIQKKIASGEFDPKYEHIKLVLHDELLVQARKENAEAMEEIIRSCMIRAGEKFIWRVPVKVDLGVGDTWYHAKSPDAKAKKVKKEAAAKLNKAA